MALRLAVVGLLMMVLTACGGSASGNPRPPTPTFQLTPSEEPSPTPDGPPTATPTLVPMIRPTLPPTWTPTKIPTDGPSPTPYTPVGAITATSVQGFSINGGVVSTAAPGCEDFGPDTSETADSIAAGSALTVHWTSTMRGVFYYLIELRDSDDALLDSTRATPTSRSYRFAGRHFDAGALYRWTVTPYDASGDPICGPKAMQIRVPS
jgi:hypothetical protein